MPSPRPYDPRRSRTDYIVQKPGGGYFYRRMVPRALRAALGKTEIWEPLYGHNHALRKLEANEKAAEDTRRFARLLDPILKGEGVPVLHDFVRIHDQSSRPPPPIWRDGRLQHPEKVYATDSDWGRRTAVEAGALPMSFAEFELQEERAALAQQAANAGTDVERRRADRVVRGIQQEIEALAEDGGVKVSVAMARWFEDEKQHPETIRHHVRHLGEFTAFHGDVAVAAVTPLMVADFMLAVRARTGKDGKRLKVGTANKRIETLKAFFRSEQVRPLYAPKPNPAAEFTSKRDNRPEVDQSYVPWTTDDCVKLFATERAAWTPRRRATASRSSDVRTREREADVHVALRLLRATGARPTEIAQMRRSDVDAERRSLTITDAESDDNALARHVKNAPSRRTVPVHPAVWPVLEAHLRRSNHVLLFPSFEPKAGAYYSKALCREWERYLRVQVNFDDPRKVLDSLRHSFACEAERIGMPDAVKFALMGHGRGNNRSANRYTANFNKVNPEERFRLMRHWLGEMKFPDLSSDGS